MKPAPKVPLWILICLASLSSTTEASYTAALTDISHYFNVKGGIAQISSTVYFLGFTLGIASLGRVSDSYGRRPVVFGGLILYLISSIMIIFTENFYILMSLRFTAAFGASVGSVIAQAMTRDSYKGTELSHAYASTSTWIALVPSIGAAVGGYIVEYYGWRHIFFLLSGISFLSLLLYIKYLPETNTALNNKRQNKYLPVMLTIMKDRKVLLYAFIIGIFGGINFSFYMEAPFILIDQIGIAPSAYGRLALLSYIAMGFGSFNSRYWISRGVSEQKITIFSLALSASGCAILVISSIFMGELTKLVAVLLVIIPIILHMIGHGMLIPLILRYALQDYSKVTGTAGSIFGALYYSITTVITFITANLHSDRTTKFAILLLFLSGCCSLAAYFINSQRFNESNKKARINLY